MSSIPQVYSNQFDQQPAVGDLDLSIMKSGVLTARLGTVSGTLIAGSRVKFDTTNSKVGAPVFVAAADDEAAFGLVKRTVQKTSFVTGDVVEIAYMGGPVMHLVGGATIAVGAGVAMGSGFLVAPGGSNVQLGIALDPVTDSAMARVVIGHVSC